MHLGQPVTPATLAMLCLKKQRSNGESWKGEESSHKVKTQSE